MKAGDWVVCKESPEMDGQVIRVARDGSWADVKWAAGWSKRMPAESLKVTDTIVRGDLTITLRRLP